MGVGSEVVRLCLPPILCFETDFAPDSGVLGSSMSSPTSCSGWLSTLCDSGLAWLLIPKGSKAGSRSCTRLHQVKLIRHSCQMHATCSGKSWQVWQGGLSVRGKLNTYLQSDSQPTQAYTGMQVRLHLHASEYNVMLTIIFDRAQTFCPFPVHDEYNTQRSYEGHIRLLDVDNRLVVPVNT